MDPSLDSSQRELLELYQRYNRTELYQLCQRAKLNVQPSWQREHYIAALLGAELPAGDNVIDELRDGLIGFIDEYWKTLQAQLKCPAKNLHNPDPDKVLPRPCYTCVDMQVVACVADMPPQHQQRLSQLRRKQ
jgi:hypothetical protein